MEAFAVGQKWRRRDGKETRISFVVNGYCCADGFDYFQDGRRIKGEDSLIDLIELIEDVPQPTSIHEVCTADEFLNLAKQAMAERGKSYDTPEGERSMRKIVRAFAAITEHNITEEEGWLFMQLVKCVRQQTAKTFHHDSAIDDVAYAALKAECGARQGNIPKDF